MNTTEQNTTEQYSAEQNTAEQNISSSDASSAGLDPAADTAADTTGDTAADRAERGSTSWEDAVRLQRWATPAHRDFSALGCELVATLYAVEDLAQVLHRQVARYQRDQQQAGRLVYDDTREMDPAERLQVAAVALTELRATAASAEFWPTRSRRPSATSASRTRPPSTPRVACRPLRPLRPLRPGTTGR